MSVNPSFSDKNPWTGRSSSEQKPFEYWHECIAFGTLAALETDRLSTPHPKVGLLGYACDEGVKRNNGRAGAVEGPVGIRQQLGRLAAHFEPGMVMDFGDVHCNNGDLEATQKSFSERVAILQSKGIFTIGMGGGHDLAYAHYKGLRQAFEQNEQPKIGILNFDAHLDLRPTIKGPTSGTPFYQIMTETQGEVPYYVVGLQPQATPQSLLATADKYKVGYTAAADCHWENIPTLKANILSYFSQCDHLYISVDLDGFSSAYAPGVSAPGPFGFTPQFFDLLFSDIIKAKNVIALDVVELNPKYDLDFATARLAAQIINCAVVSKYGNPYEKFNG